MFGSYLRGIALLSTLAPLVSAAHIKRSDLHRRHDELAHSSPSNTPHTLEKRQSYSNVRMTYYTDGLGSCGTTNAASDFIVALDSALYDAGSYCGDWITISYNGKTAQAQIMDRCPGCPVGGLDLSDGLFSYFADESVGVIYADWSLGSGSVATTSSAAAPVPTTTSQTPTPTTTSSAWTPTTSWTPTTTSTWTPSSSSTWSSSSSSSSVLSSSAVPSSSAWSSSSAAASSSSWSAPSASASAVGLTTGNQLELLNQAVVGLAGLLVAGAEVQ